MQLWEHLQTTSRRGDIRARVGGLGVGRGCRRGAPEKDGQRLRDTVGGVLESRQAGEDLHRGCGGDRGGPQEVPHRQSPFLL